MLYQRYSLNGVQVTLDDDTALPVSLGSLRKRLSLSTKELDDQLCEQVLEITEQLEADVTSYLRPATVVQYFDYLFGVTHYPQVMYLGGYQHWPRYQQVPFDLKLARWPYVEADPDDPALTVEYLAPDDTWQSYTDFLVHESSVPTSVRFLEPLPEVKNNAVEAWRITYRSYYKKVPMLAKRAIIQRVVDEFENRGLDREDDLGWQKAVRSLIWGPL